MNFGFDYEVDNGNVNAPDSSEFNIKGEYDIAIEIRAIKYLCLLKEPAKILNSMVAYQAVKYLAHFSNKQAESGFNWLNSDIKSLFVTTFIEFLNRQLQNFDQLVNKFENPDTGLSVKKSTEIFYLEMRFDYLGQFLSALSSFTQFNSQFVAKYFENNNGIKILCQYVNNKHFLARINEYFSTHRIEAYEALKWVFDFLIRIIFNLSRYFTKLNNSADNASNRLSRKSWTDSSAFEILSVILTRIDFMPDTRILIYLTLANLFSDDDRHNILGKNEQLDRCVIQNLVLLVEILASQIENKTVLRIRMHGFMDSLDEINNNTNNNSNNNSADSSSGERSSEIACVNESGHFTLLDILNCLYNLALNDNLKYELYKNFDVKKYIR
jgi:hypothetical protein